MLREGAASMADIRVEDRLVRSTGEGIEAWMARMTSDEREQFMRRLGTLVVVLDELADLPWDAAPWPPAMTEERRRAILDAIAVPAAVASEIDQRNPLPSRTWASP